MNTDTNRQLPFDVNDPEVQRACRAVARWLLGEAGAVEARRTTLAVLIAATGQASGRGPRFGNGRGQQGSPEVSLGL